MNPIDFRLARVTGYCFVAAMGLVLVGQAQALTSGAVRAQDAPTDQIIVRYKDNSGARTRPEVALAASAALRGAAGRLGMSGTQLRTTALGAQVWSVGRNVAAAEAEGLIKGLKASHPDIERPLLA